MGVIQGDTTSLDYGSYANKQSGPLPRHQSNYRLVVQPRLLINEPLPLTGIVIGILRLGPLKGGGLLIMHLHGQVPGSPVLDARHNRRTRA